MSAKNHQLLKTTVKMVQVIERETIRDHIIGGISFSIIIATVFEV